MKNDPDYELRIVVKNISDKGLARLYNRYASGAMDRGAYGDITPMENYLNSIDKRALIKDVNDGKIKYDDNFIMYDSKPYYDNDPEPNGYFSAKHVIDFLESNDWVEVLKSYIDDTNQDVYSHVDVSGTPLDILGDLYDSGVQLKGEVFERIMKLRGIETTKSRHEKNVMEQYLLRHGINQNQVAVASGLSRSTINSASKRSVSNQTVTMIEALAKTVHQAPAQVLDELFEIEKSLK